VVNASINQTISRTLMTSFTTLLVLFALFFLGGEAIHAFSTALIVGIVVGTYSSIYIASTAALLLGISRSDLLLPEKDSEDMARP
jgi:preprotein translocase subunit SecF